MIKRRINFKKQVNVRNQLASFSSQLAQQRVTSLRILCIHAGCYHAHVKNPSHFSQQHALT